MDTVVDTVRTHIIYGFIVYGIQSIQKITIIYFFIFIVYTRVYICVRNTHSRVYICWRKSGYFGYHQKKQGGVHVAWTERQVEAWIEKELKKLG